MEMPLHRISNPGKWSAAAICSGLNITQLYANIEGKMQKMEENRKIWNRVLIFVSAIAVLMLISSCQSLPFRAPEQNLTDRVASMMTERVSQDWASVYAYLDPSYKKKVDKQEFVSMDRNIEYGNFEIKSVNVDETGRKAAVVVRYDMSMMSFDIKNHLETQDWLKIGGRWYYKMKTDPLMGKD
jgi:uncharacterized protein YchJ